MGRHKDDSSLSSSQSRSRSLPKRDDGYKVHKDRVAQKSSRDNYRRDRSRSGSRDERRQDRKKYYKSRSRSVEKKHYEKDQRQPWRGNNREDNIAKRIADRSNLIIRKSIWEYSTDEEDYKHDITTFWEKQAKEKAQLETERKQKEERQRLKKLQRIQKNKRGQDDQNLEGEDNQNGVKNDSDLSSEEDSDSNGSDNYDSDSSSSSFGDSSSKDEKKKKKKKDKKNKQLDKKAKSGKGKVSDEDNDSGDSGFESDDSFAKQCREKINGPDQKKKDQKGTKNKSAASGLTSHVGPKMKDDDQNQDSDEDYDNYSSDPDNPSKKKQQDQQQGNHLDNMMSIGPMPLLLMENKRDTDYTGLLPGEGDAIAHYVEEGKRIPRRGEVGLSSEQIQKFEDLGYVMSGSRHRRMNAVRQMKEAKVISQQQKKAMAIYNYQQKNKVETKLHAYFKGMLEEKIADNKHKEQD